MLSGLIHLLKSLKEQDIKKSLYFKVLSILFFIISLFTKENMVVLLPLSILIIIIYNIIDKNNYVKKTSTLIYIFILTIITASYILMKFTIFNFSENKGLTNFSNIYTNNLHIRLLTFISVIWDYIKLIIYPINLHYEKPYIAYTQLLTWRSIFGFTLIGTTILTLVKIKQQPYLFLSSSWFFASLAPYTGIIPLNAMYLEHWLYVPIIGFSFLIAFLFEVYLNKKKYLMYLLLLLFALYSTRVIIRNEEWADVEKFYNKELKYSKNALRIYNNLGLYYANTAEKYKNNKKIFYNYNNKAKQYYQKAISISDVYPQPHHNLGNIYLSEGKIQEAFNEYIFALSIDPNFVYSLVKLYDIYKTTGQLEKAEHILKLVNKIEEGNKIAFQDIQQILINY